MENRMFGTMEIRMLGGFTISYDGQEIALGRSSTAKFIQLLQIVWLHGEKGISKEQVMNSLYDREQVSNINNSLNNLIYRMRRQMVQAGLPEAMYICNQDGLCVIDESIPVNVDAAEFKSLMEKGNLSVGESEKASYYVKAAKLYQGEFLPALSTETWVMMESLQLKRVFETCVRWLGDYLKKQKDYEAAYRLYTRAAKIYPFDDWQVHQIDSLICRGEYKEAYRLYDKTVKLYSDELGIPPSGPMLKCYQRMSGKLTCCPNELQVIKSELEEFEEEGGQYGEGAYCCSYPSFLDAYRLMSRIMERSGQSVFLMLCTLVDYEGKMIQNQEKLKKRSDLLKKAIQQSLRRGDAYTKYSNSQYLVLLVGTKQEDCSVVYRRINRKLKELAGPRAELSFNVTSLSNLHRALD